MEELLKCILLIYGIPKKHGRGMLNKPPMGSLLTAHTVFEQTTQTFL